MCPYISNTKLEDSLSSWIGSGSAEGVWMSVSETRFLNRLSFDLVAIMVVSMAPCTQ